MANFTSKFNLRKPLSSENYNVDDQNNNMDTLDQYAVGFGPGLTNTLLIPGGALAPLKFELDGALAGNRFMSTRRVGEAQVGWMIDWNGTLQWGPGGSTAPDVNLYRAGTNTLKTDHNLFLAGASMQTVSASAGACTSTAAALADAPTTGAGLTLNFTAPPSGKIAVTIGAWLYHTAGALNNGALMTARISGSAGTQGSNNANGILSELTTRIGCSRRYLVTGLTPLATGTLTTQYARTGASGTANYDLRTVMIEPCLG